MLSLVVVSKQLHSTNLHVTAHGWFGGSKAGYGECPHDFVGSSSPAPLLNGG